MVSYLKRIWGYRKYISTECIMTFIYFLCMPFTIVTTPFGSLLKVITYPVTAMLIYKLFIGKKRPLGFNSVHFVYTLYIIVIFMDLMIFRSEQANIITKDMFLSYIVAMLISMRVYNRYERELIEQAWIIVGIVCVVLCLTSTEVANQYEDRTIVYIFGSMEDPNQFCAYFILPVMVSLRRITQRRKFRLFYLALIFLAVYCVFKTGSRGGLLGILTGIAFYIWLGTKNLRLKLMYLAIGAVFTALLITVVLPSLPENIQQRYTIEDVEKTGGTGRLEIWKYLINYTAEKPERIIAGSGIMSTEPILEAQKWRETFRVARGAHNQFVQVFTDQGVIGLFIYIMIMVACVFRNLKKRPEYSSAFVAIMAFAMSLTMYVFKPYINVLMMCAMNFEEETGDNCQENRLEGEGK